MKGRGPFFLPAKTLHIFLCIGSINCIGCSYGHRRFAITFQEARAVASLLSLLSAALPVLLQGPKAPPAPQPQLPPSPSKCTRSPGDSELSLSQWLISSSQNSTLPPLPREVPGAPQRKRSECFQCGLIALWGASSPPRSSEAPSLSLPPEGRQIPKLLLSHLRSPRCFPNHSGQFQRGCG